jgi:hypothetical protein
MCVADYFVKHQKDPKFFRQKRHAVATCSSAHDFFFFFFRALFDFEATDTPLVLQLTSPTAKPVIEVANMEM